MRLVNLYFAPIYPRPFWTILFHIQRADYCRSLTSRKIVTTLLKNIRSVFAETLLYEASPIIVQLSLNYRFGKIGGILLIHKILQKIVFIFLHESFLPLSLWYNNSLLWKKTNLLTKPDIFVNLGFLCEKNGARTGESSKSSAIPTEKFYLVVTFVDKFRFLKGIFSKR